MALKTDYKDAIPASGTMRKYKQIDNGDGTISFQDVTEYSQEGDKVAASVFNGIGEEVNGKAEKSDIPTSLPANGGNAATLGGVSPGYRSDGAQYIPVVGAANGPLEIGSYIDFHKSGSTTDFDGRLELKGDGGGLSAPPPTNLASAGMRNIVYHATPSTDYLGDGVLELIPKS